MTNTDYISLAELFEKRKTGEWGLEGDADTGIPVLRTTNFNNDGTLSLENISYRSFDKKKNFKNKFLTNGDILIEKSGGSDTQPVGRVVFFEGEENKYLNNNFTAVLRNGMHDKFLSRYVFYFLRWNYENGTVRKYQNRTTGLHNLQLESYLSSLSIPILSLDEQLKVIEIINGIERIVLLLKQQISKYDDLVKSRFIEMFGTFPNNEKQWKVKSIGQIAKEVKYGTSHPASSDGKYLYLRMNNITYDGYLDLTDIKRITIPESEFDKYSVKKGDVLFNRTNSKDLVGKTCVYDQDFPMILAGFIIRIRVNEEILPEFLSTFLNMEFSKNMLKSMCKTAIGQANINSQELKGILMFVPPIELQRSFISFKLGVDKSKLAIQESIDELEKLKKSLMQDYFG